MRWPWQLKLGDGNPYAPKLWPKRVYFLDGPLSGKMVNDVRPCREFYVLGNSDKSTTTVWDALAYINILRPTYTSEATYIWDTLYPNGNVAYMRLA